ncbi:MAG: hypothetical protein JXA20_06960 [Spirochaetes bacterium]|nr:hypothetical protein [Spirochaetota bacterium]
MEHWNITLYFALYSFTGWIIEALYRSWTQRRPVNPGFLFGPFVPIYGIGALMVLLLHQVMAPLNPALQFLAYGAVLSLVEYAAGEFFERAFGLKLWDYSDSRFSLRGKISLPFSLAWAALAMILAYLLHPLARGAVAALDRTAALAFSAVFLSYFAADVTVSVISLRRFRRDIAYLYERYVTLSNREVQRIIGSFRRILGAFPDLNRHLQLNLNEHLKARLDRMMGRLSRTLEAAVADRRPQEAEYLDIVKDILAHPEFLRLKDFFHHNSSIYEHARIVSYLSYRVCRYLDLDYVSAARGGLLHDFFLYDWRNHDAPDLPREKFHGLEHPRIALENSLKYFTLNDTERDIIVKHMWPLTFLPPRYRESFVVTFVDKYVSSREFVDEFRKRRKAAAGKDASTGRATRQKRRPRRKRETKDL